MGLVFEGKELIHDHVRRYRELASSQRLVRMRVRVTRLEEHHGENEVGNLLVTDEHERSREDHLGQFGAQS